MSWLAVGFTCLLTAQAPVAVKNLDVRLLATASPTTLTEIDTGALRGEPRQLAWAPDRNVLYLQTVEGKAPQEKLHHYTIAVIGGAVTRVEAPPAWAVDYWRVKQDRIAPGLPSVELAIVRRQETRKAGTGPSGVLDRQSSPSGAAAAGPNMENLANGTFANEKADVWVLSLADAEVTRWVNDPRPVPGVRFSWGPSGSGALVAVGDGGRLVFFDASKHRKDVEDIKDALLPAWSTDGSALAFLRRTARKKYALMMLTVGVR